MSSQVSAAGTTGRGNDGGTAVVTVAFMVAYLIDRVRSIFDSGETDEAGAKEDTE